MGIDSTAALMQQHQDIYKRSLKERALQNMSRKVFKDEMDDPALIDDKHLAIDEDAQM